MLLQIICAIFAWSLIGLSVWRIRQTVREGLNYLQKIHQVPCHRCAYFTGDYRLKCTVKPISAMTEEAINCEDFENKSDGVKLSPVVLKYSSQEYKKTLY